MDFSDAIAANRIHGFKIKLFVSRAKIQKKFKNFFLRHLRVGGGLVYFVDHDNRLQAQLKGFFEHESCLGHRTFLRVNDQKNAVNRAQNPFHFRTKISVAWGVHNVDFCIFIEHRSVLGINCDAALFFKSVAVHSRGFIFFHSGLAHDGVGDGRFAVVDMGNDGDVSNFHKNKICFASRNIYPLQNIIVYPSIHEKRCFVKKTPPSEEGGVNLTRLVSLESRSALWGFR